MKDIKKMHAWIVIGAVAALAVMGLAFCWACPDTLDVGGHCWFRHQLAYNVIGIAACCGAAMISWKGWLNVAPFVAAGWVVMFAAALCCGSCVNGSLVVSFGPVRLSVMGCLPFALSMLLAWLAEKFKWRAVPLVSCAAVVLLCLLAAGALCNPTRVERLKEFFAGEPPPAVCEKYYVAEYVQAWLQNAFAAAKWFTPGDVSNLEYLPGMPAQAMPATAAVAFGKWFLVLGGLLFGAIAVAMAWLCRCTKDETKKAWTIVAGLGIVVPAVWGFCECLGLVPMRYTGVPIASYGCTMVLLPWLTAGVFCSLAKHEAST